MADALERGVPDAILLQPGEWRQLLVRPREPDGARHPHPDGQDVPAVLPARWPALVAEVPWLRWSTCPRSPRTRAHA
eukprot:70228-Alexandrium_andersonii.AAC.1